MKRNYIIPTTESIAFRAGSICDASAGAGGMNIGGGALGGGGEANTGGKPIVDPL